MLSHYPLSLLLCCYSRPEGKEARPYAYAHDETGPVPELAYVPAGMRPLIYEIEINTVEEAVPLIPAVLKNGRLQLRRVLSVLRRNLAEIQTVAEVGQSFEFTIHEAVQVDRT